LRKLLIPLSLYPSIPLSLYPSIPLSLYLSIPLLSIYPLLQTPVTQDVKTICNGSEYSMSSHFLLGSSSPTSAANLESPIDAELDDVSFLAMRHAGHSRYMQKVTW
jgi:hypothetical protein